LKTSSTVFFVFFFFLIVLIVSLLTVLFVPTASANPTLEDFTTYTEVDPNSHLSKLANAVDHKGYRNEDCYLYKNESANYFGNFTHLIDMKPVGHGSTSGGWSSFWMLSKDTVDDWYGLANANKTAICVAEAYSGGHYISVGEAYGGTQYWTPSALYLTEGVQYYLIIVKFGTSLTATVYSDSARTSTVGARNLTLHADHTFTHIFAGNTYNDGTGGTTKWTQVYIGNLELHGHIPYNDDLTLDLAGAAFKGTKTLLTGKQDYKFVHKVSDVGGVTNITYAQIQLNYATKNVILRATRGSGDAWTFSEYSDPLNYVTLNTGGSSHSTSGNQKTFNYLVTINWNWDDASETLAVRAYVVDSTSPADQDDYANIFGVENDLSSSSLSVNDYRCNPSQTLTFSGYWYYEGTSIAPPDGNYAVVIKLSGVQKGSNDTTLVSGAFSISDVTAESTVNSYSYTVEATYMSGAGSFSAVIVDRIKILSYAVSDSKANINDNVNIDAALVYEYGGTAVTTGTITINGYSASHQGSGVYRITRTSSSATSVTYDTVAGSESTYDLNTVNQNGKSTTVIWDGLSVFNIQAPEYLGNATFGYKAQIKYAYNSSTINGASVNISLPSGSIIGQVTSNATGWISFTLFQSNATESGSYTIFGINDNNYGITVSITNQTFTLRSWTCNSVDYEGNGLSATTLNVTTNSETVYSGGDVTIQIPEDTFNITITWYTIQVNITANLVISGDTSTNFTCLAYPYVYESTRYWVASNATISSVTWNSNIFTVQFSGSPATYILKASCTVKPSYILNCTYDYDTDWTTMLTLTHYANTTIKIAYPNWGGFYVKKTDYRLISIGWTGESLSLTFTGNTGNVGEVKLYCADRGVPIETSGFAATSYSVSTKTFVGTYAFGSDKTVSVSWATSGTPSEGGPPSGQTTSLLISINIVLQPLINAGSQVDGVINVKWSGATIVYVYDVKFENFTAWFSVAQLPYKLQKAFENVQGESAIKVKVSIPSNAEPGNYLIPCLVIFRTEAAQDITLGGTLKFEVLGAPSTIPDYMVLVFLSVFAIILLGAMTRSKQKA